MVSFLRVSLILMSLAYSAATFSATLKELKEPVSLKSIDSNLIFKHEKSAQGQRSISGERKSIFVSGISTNAKMPQANFVLAKPVSMGHERFFQTYKGLRVKGGSLIQHQGVDGMITVTGVMIEHIAEDIPSTEPVLSKEEAISIARLYQESQGYQLHQVREYGFLEIALDPETQKAHLVYEIVARGSVNDQEWKDLRTWVDATTGKILKIWDNTAHYDMEGKGGSSWPAYFGDVSLKRSNAYSFKKNPQGPYEFGPLNVQKKGDRCWFKATGSQIEEVSTYTLNDIDMDLFLETHDIPHNYNDFKSLGIVSVDCESGPQDELMTNARSPEYVQKIYSQLNDSHYYAVETQKMFLNWYNVSPFAGSLHVVTHAQFCNAFAIPPLLNNMGEPLDPEVPEQVWIGTGYEIEGKNFCAVGLATPDVLAHELGHLVTGNYSNLAYEGQSGGINEAFSDMTGLAFQDFLYQQYQWATYGYWIGGQVMIIYPYYIRSMAEPEVDGFSISHYDSYNDDLNVHASSGIFNKAFYNLAVDYKWGVKKAYHLMLVANMHYWTEHETFNSAVCGLYSAASELGYNSKKEIKEIESAFSRQGVYCKK